MPQFAANLSTMFTEWPFLDRFAVAADHGFSAVEVRFPYEFSADTVAKRLEAAKIALVLLSAPPGDFAAGERGLAALPERGAEFRASIDEARRYVEATGARRVHVMAGIADPKDARVCDAYASALRHAVEALDGVEVLIEPLNTRDAPGYFLRDFDLAEQFIAHLGLPRLRLQYDIYHRQILCGDVLTSLETLLPILGHVQIASVPRRQEPSSGELDDERILSRLDALGYSGYVGCEYRPARGTVAGLGWHKAWRKRRGGGVTLKPTWRDKLG